MPATAPSVKPKADPMELYRLRDELVETHKPANAHERMLVTHIAQAWLRFQRATEAEQRYFEKNDIVDVISTRLQEFKAVTRYASDCDRAFRQAVTLLKNAQTKRRREDLSSPNARRGPAKPVWPELSPDSIPPAPAVIPTPQSRE